MTRRARLIWLSVVGLAAAGLGVAAIAWACTPQAFISVSPSSGPPGSVVTVTGQRFVADGRVELRMGSVDSAPVATATGPSFSVEVTIPQDVKPGQTVIIGALGYDQDGQPAAQPAAGFTVPAASPPAKQASPVTRPAPKHAVATHPASAPTSQPQHRPGATSPARPAVVPSTAAAVRSATQPTVAAPAPKAASPAAPVHTAPVRAPAARAEAVKHAPAHARVTAPAEAAQPWAPAPVPASSNGSSGLGTPLAIGIGLLAAGLVALFAGFAVAEVRRRRAPVRTRK